MSEAEEFLELKLREPARGAEVKLAGLQSHAGISAAVVVAEFHLEHSWGERFDNRTDLSSYEVLTWLILQKGRQDRRV